MIQPRTVEEIQTDLQTQLDDGILALNNFVEGSFNFDFIRAYAEEIHEYEVRLKVAELAGFPEFAGKQLDQQDLEDLEIGYLDPAELNEFQDPRQLDRLGKLVGATRSPGSKATGTLEITTSNDNIQIPEGTSFTTDPVSGRQLEFRVDADGDGTITPDNGAFVSPNPGSTTVTVDAIAADVGVEFNVPASSVTFLPSPPPGVESVTNPGPFTGGEDRQSTESFRDDVTQAVAQSSGGVTEAGIEGRVEDRTDATDVFVDENLAVSPPTVDVIVSGGTLNTVEREVETARPVGIDATVIRPDSQRVGVDLSLRGSDIDVDGVVTEIVEFIGGIGLGGSVRRGQLTSSIIGADGGILDIGALNLRIIDVSRETFTYRSGTSQYRLASIPLGRIKREQQLFDSTTSVYGLAVDAVDASSVTVEALVDGTTRTLSRGSTADYVVIDDDGDGSLDSIEFVSSGTTPDDATTFTVDYDHGSFGIDSVEDASGTTYTVGTDIELVDADGDGRPDTLDWSINSTSPDDGEQFTVDYRTNTSIVGDAAATARQTFVTSPGDVTIQTN